MPCRRLTIEEFNNLQNPTPCNPDTSCNGDEDCDIAWGPWERATDGAVTQDFCVRQGCTMGCDDGCSCFCISLDQFETSNDLRLCPVYNCGGCLFEWVGGEWVLRQGCPDLGDITPECAQTSCTPPNEPGLAEGDFGTSKCGSTGGCPSPDCTGPYGASPGSPWAQPTCAELGLSVVGINDGNNFCCCPPNA